MLQSGINIRLAPEVEVQAPLCERVQVNSGTRRLAAGRSSDSRYADGIFVPKDDWSSPVPQTLALIGNGGPAHQSRLIRVFKIPDYLYRLSWDMGLDVFFDTASESQTRTDPLVAEFCREAARVLGLIYAPATSLSLQLRDTALSSSTFDQEADIAIGLHVDNFDRQAIDQRHNSRCRMVVNLGTETRSLVFINLDLMQLVDCCQLGRTSDVFERYRWAYPLAHLFMATHPAYPAIKLQLHPGEGYLAPTQNFIHDGYTLGMTAPDLTLHAAPEPDQER